MNYSIVTLLSKDGHRYQYKTDLSVDEIKNKSEDIIQAKGWSQYEYKIENILHNCLDLNKL